MTHDCCRWNYRYGASHRIDDVSILCKVMPLRKLVGLGLWLEAVCLLKGTVAVVVGQHIIIDLNLMSRCSMLDAHSFSFSFSFSYSRRMIWRMYVNDRISTDSPHHVTHQFIAVPAVVSLQFRLEVKFEFGVFGAFCCVWMIILLLPFWICVAAVTVAISDLFQSSRLIDGMDGFVPRRMNESINQSINRWMLSPSDRVSFSTVRVLLLRTAKTTNYSTVRELSTTS